LLALSSSIVRFWTRLEKQENRLTGVLILMRGRRGAAHRPLIRSSVWWGARYTVISANSHPSPWFRVRRAATNCIDLDQLRAQGLGVYFYDVAGASERPCALVHWRGAQGEWFPDHLEYAAQKASFGRRYSAAAIWRKPELFGCSPNHGWMAGVWERGQKI